ncbi:MAG: NDP-sugar synthase, partial [Syntrophomonadaceae bacterium]|nr:NDP-sugar synthase [Syntrophomonadaceae bacterium]
FQEKPRPEEALSNLANTGIYIFEPEIFKYIPARQFYDFGKQVFPHLVKIGAPFYGTVINDYWCDVGNLETYRQAHSDILEGKVNVAIEGEIKSTSHGKVLLGEGTVVDPEVTLEGNIVLGSGCRVEKGAVIRDSVVWANTTISRNAVLEKCVLGQNCLIGRNTEIKPGAVIASGCNLEDNIDINAGQKVFSSPTDATILNQG